MTSPSPVSIGIATILIGLSATAFPHSSAQAQVSTDRPIKSHVSHSGSVPKKTDADATDQTEVIGCLIEPNISSQVAAGAPGVITEVKVDRGDPVKRGQVLAVLDNDVEQALLRSARARSETQAAVNAARATRNMAYQKLRRFRKLNALSYGARMELELAAGEFSVAESRLQQAQDEHKAARSDHSVAKHQLARRQVLSPIDGIVADRLLNPGERADGRAIVRIVQIDRLRVEVIMPASQFGKIHAGMLGEVVPDLAESDSVQATVEQVDRFIDAASGTFRARLTMNNSSLAVPAGVRCSVRFAKSDQRPAKG